MPTMTWADRAACRGMTVDTFYTSDDATDTERERVQAAAKMICRICPSRLDCLDWALNTAEAEGVWGGLTADERRILRRRKHMRIPRTVILQPCGTLAAYRRHQRNGEPVCEPCAQKNRLAAAERKAALKQAVA
jgi:WhiB family redox-sensing transcriptional regulator